MLYAAGQNGLNVRMALKQKETGPEVGPVREAGFDDLLVAVGRGRSRDAFVRLFGHFAPRVKSFLIKGGMSAEQADELAQDTMLTVWNKAETFDPAKASAATWIYTIARNRRIDFLRKAPPPAAGEDAALALPDQAALPDEAAIGEESGRRLDAAVSALPAEQADLVRRAFFEDKTHAAIAEETGIPLGTVKSRIRLALERMRGMLEADDEKY